MGVAAAVALEGRFETKWWGAVEDVKGIPLTAPYDETRCS